MARYQRIIELVREHRWPLGLALLLSVWVCFVGGPKQRLPLTYLPGGPAADDVVIHSNYIASAGAAQSEGNLLPRETPRLNWPTADRFAFYQFYSFVPYHLAGFLTHFGVGPYQAFVLIVFLSFFIGAVGAYGLTRAMGWSAEAGLVCATAFSLAPYHLGDLFGRYAFPELVSFGLAPCLLWASLRLAQSPSLGLFLATAALWAVQVLTHNIFHVWTVPVAAFWLLHLKWLGGRRELALIPAGAAYLLGLAMTWFFFVVPLRHGGEVIIASIFSETLTQGLTPLWVLLYPTWAQLYVTGSLGSPDLGLQIGWPQLFGFIAALQRQTWRVLGNASWLIFLVMAFMAWSPFYFWPWLGPFKIISFPYRLLMYTSLFGSLLLAHWYHRLPQWQARKWLPWVLAGLLLLSLDWKRTGGLGIPSSSMVAAWSANGPRVPANTVQYALNDGALLKYKDHDLGASIPGPLLRGAGPSKLAWLAPAATGVQVVDFKPSVNSKLSVVVAPGGAVLILPSFWYPKLYRVRLDGVPHPYGFVGPNLSVNVPAGKHSLEYRFTGDRPANWISLFALAFWLWLLWRWAREREA